MPTKRTRRTRGRHRDIPTAAWYFINDALDELKEEKHTHFDLFGLKDSIYPHKELSELWKTNRNAILKSWMLTKPGTRPHCWWLFDVPLPNSQKMATAFDKEPRIRLSGVGTPAYEVLNVVPSFKYGIPSSWVSKFDEDYYTGTANDISGNLISPKEIDDNFNGVAIDPSNPPIFESQASYLDRFGLLSAAEKKKSDFNPESVVVYPHK